MIIKALTVPQPGATLIAVGAKTIETRSWPTPYRGWIAIHARKGPGGWSGPLLRMLYTEEPFASALAGADLPRGAVVAIARLTQCRPTQDAVTRRLPAAEPIFGNFVPGRWMWVLSDVQPMDPPIPTSGAQGWWDWVVPPAIEAGLPAPFFPLEAP